MLAQGVLVATAPGCRTPRPGNEQWLAVGFRSPRQAFKTFQTALAADALTLEYRCVSSSFRRGASQLGYREVREQILREQPWLRRAALAEITAEQRLSPTRARLQARVGSLFGTVEFEVELVASGYAEVWGEEELLWDEARDAAPVPAAFGTTDSPSKPPTARIELDPTAEFDPRSATELRVGLEWRIDAIRSIDPR